MKYFCSCCNYDAKVKSSYDKHLKTKKHILAQKVYSQDIGDKKKNLGKLPKNIGYFRQKNSIYVCPYCEKSFKHQSSMSKHVNHTCKYNSDKKMKELVSLLNEQNNKKDEQLAELHSQIKELLKKLEETNKNVNHNNIVQGNQNIIQLNNYNQTDYNLLSKQDYIKSIKTCNHCVKTLVEKLHFNPNFPQNMNIFVSSYKGKFVMVFRNGKWQISDKKKEIDNLFESNEIILENWLEEHGENYPSLIKLFNRYINNKEKDDELTDLLKDEILVMLYNNRDLIEKRNLIKDNNLIPEILNQNNNSII
jgi:uncharacterized C2H2 Zn-finger protein